MHIKRSLPSFRFPGQGVCEMQMQMHIMTTPSPCRINAQMCAEEIQSNMHILMFSLAFATSACRAFAQVTN